MTDITADTLPPVAFYAVADARFFPGLAAMLNSLRLVGHTEPVFVVDAGLTAGSATRCSPTPPSCPPRGDAAVFLAPAGPMQRPAEVMVLIDADIIVTRPLRPMSSSRRAAGTWSRSSTSRPTSDRWFTGVEDALGLGHLRRQPYLNAGLVVSTRHLADRLLPPWTIGQAAIGITPADTAGPLDDPFYFADQDVLNALLGSVLEAGEIARGGLRARPVPALPRSRHGRPERSTAGTPTGSGRTCCTTS